MTTRRNFLKGAAGMASAAAGLARCRRRAPARSNPSAASSSRRQARSTTIDVQARIAIFPRRSTPMRRRVPRTTAETNETSEQIHRPIRRSALPRHDDTMAIDYRGGVVGAINPSH